MKMCKRLALLLALVMVLALFSGCGAASKMEAYDNAMEAPAAEAGDYAYSRTEEVMEEVAVEDSLTDTETGSTALPQNQKIITTLNMRAETEDMDPLLAGIGETVTQLGGYMEAQEIYNGSNYNSYRNRYADLTVRIPADQLDSFVTHVGEKSNIVSQSTTTENVTLQYVAVESRIKALQTEETRLLELLAMAENMEDLLLIESRLTEVRTELEQVQSTLRTMDNKINYSTVHLNISEVKEYTEIQPVPKTFWERISTGIAQGFENVGEFLVDLGVFLIVAIPYLLPVAVIGLAVLFIIRGSIRRKRKKNATKNSTQQNP